MEIKAKTRTEQILTVMNIVVWVAYIGLLIQTGAVLISYGVSCVNPEAAKNLNRGLDLFDLRQSNFWYYTSTVSFIVALSAMKAYVAFLVTRVLEKVNLVNPFTTEVALKLEKISHILLGTWVVGLLSSAHNEFLLKRTGNLYGEWSSGEVIFMAGLVFIMAQIFKRGVEIQSENDLTV